MIEGDDQNKNVDRCYLSNDGVMIAIDFQSNPIEITNILVLMVFQ